MTIHRTTPNRRKGRSRWRNPSALVFAAAVLLSGGEAPFAAGGAAEAQTPAPAAPEPRRLRSAGVVIPVESLACGNGKMDENLRKALKAREHPAIEFRLREGTLVEPVADGHFLVQARGEIRVAGVTGVEVSGGIGPVLWLAGVGSGVTTEDFQEGRGYSYHGKLSLAPEGAPFDLSASVYRADHSGNPSGYPNKGSYSELFAGNRSGSRYSAVVPTRPGDPDAGQINPVGGQDQLAWQLDARVERGPLRLFGLSARSRTGTSTAPTGASPARSGSTTGPRPGSRSPTTCTWPAAGAARPRTCSAVRPRTPRRAGSSSAEGTGSWTGCS